MAHQFSERRRRHRSRRRAIFQFLEPRYLLAGDWQNPVLAEDVDGSGFVGLNDALTVIDDLRTNGNPHDLLALPAAGPPPYVDVDGNDLVSVTDLLQIVGTLRDRLGAAAPVIEAALAHDTARGGGVNQDGVTFYATIAGAVTQNRTDQLIVIAVVDGAAFFAVDVDDDGTFSFAPPSLAEGAHTVEFFAQNAGGPVGTYDVAFQFDATAPSAEISVQGELLETIASLEVAFSEPLGDAALAAENYELEAFGGGPAPAIVSVAAIDDATVRLDFAAELEDGAYRLVLNHHLADAAGNLVAGGPFEFVIRIGPAGIRELSPADGEEMVSVTRETTVRFDAPMDPATVTDESFFLIAGGERIPGRVVVSSTEEFATFFYDQPLPASTEVRVTVDGNQIMTRDGALLDADGDGQPGGVRTSDFRTLPLTRIAGTNVWGFLKDAYTGEPIVGATIRVDGFPEANAVTDETGRYDLFDMPAPMFFVHLDGTTATNAPDGFTYPSVGKPFPSVPGETIQMGMNGVPMDLFLPPVALADITSLSMTEPTDVGLGAAGLAELQTMFPDADPAMFEKVQVVFPPGSARFEDGTPSTQATVIPVPPDRLPGPLPPNLNPSLVLSVQAGGATNFDVPAPITFPNLEGLAPGEKSLIFWFNHDAGRFDVIGTGTVSAAGLEIVSDEGVGLLTPGWGFVQPGSPTSGGGGGGDDGGGGGGGDDGDDDSDDDETEPATFEVAITAEGTIPSLSLGFRGEVRVPDLVDLESDFAVSTRPAPFGPLSILSNTFTVGGESAIANVLRQFQGQLELLSVSATVRGQVGLNPTTGGIVVNEGDTHITITLPDASLAGVSVTLTAGGAACGVAGYIGGLASLCGDGVTVGLDMGINSIPLDEVLIPLPDADRDGRPDPATEAVNGEVTFAALPFADVTFGSYFLNGFLRELADSQLVNPAPEFTAGEAETSADLAAPVSTRDSIGNDVRSFYRFFVPATGTEIAGQTSREGQLNAVLPSEADFSLFLYNPRSNQFTLLTGTTSRSGVPTFVSAELEFFGGIDTDRDGLPDIGEITIGTSPENPDSDGDGIDDVSEIEQGLDPLGDRGFPTGVIATLPLRGEAREVVVEGSTLDGESQTAYVATGSHGLSIVDVSRFNNPILLGQLDLPGANTDVAVDSRLQIAAVAGGSGGLHLIDVSDPMLPTLIRTLNAPATQVAAFEGVVYAASGGTLRNYDLLTGERLDERDYDGGNIDDMALAEGFLYTIQHSGVSPHRINKIALTSDLAPPVASLALHDFPTFGRMHIAAGAGLIYVGSPDESFANQVPGIEILRDEGDTLTLIGPPSPITAFEVALNGSGLALFGGANTAGPSGADFGLLDVSDPTQTDRFLTSFPTPGGVQSIAIGSGIAYVADDSGGLQVINYLPFDNQGQPPQATITSPQLDLDPVVPGVQVTEGASIPITVEVTDDVQVRNVELFVNGRVVRNDVSFPFDFEAIALNDLADTITVQVRATDTGGNATLSDPLEFELVPDTFGPQITGVTPAEGAVRGRAFRTVRIAFSEPMDEATLNAVNVQLRDADGNAYTPMDIQARESARVVQLTYESLALGEHQIVINGAAVTDRAGNPVGAAEIVSTFTVADNTDAVWSNPHGGVWDDPENWQDGVVPAAGANVVIEVTPDAVIEHRTGTTVINSLTITGALRLSGGTLEVAAPYTIGSGFAVAGGALRNTTVLPGAGGQSIAVTSSLDATGTLDGVALEADMELMGSSTRVRIANGLTVNGTVRLASQFHSMQFVGSQTLSGSGQVVFNRGDFEMVSPGGTLTIGPDLTLRGAGGNLGGNFSSMSIVNEGTIVAEGLAPFLIAPVGQHSTFRNNGSLRAAGGRLIVDKITGELGGAVVVNGGQLEVDGTFTNSQDRSVADGSGLSFRGNWTNTAAIDVNGGALLLSGEWENQGTIEVTNSTFDLDSSSAFGTISVSQSQLTFFGVLTTAQMREVNVDFATTVVTISAHLDNRDDVLLVNSATAAWTLANGRIDGGVVQVADGASLLVPSGNNVLTGVTFHGTMELMRINPQANPEVRIADGLTLNGMVRLGSVAGLRFDGTQLLDGAGEIIFTDGGALRMGAAGILTIGPDITIRGRGGRIGSSSTPLPQIGIVNHGTIVSQVAGETLSIRPTHFSPPVAMDFTFTNHGVVRAAAGTLEIEGLQPNQGLIAADRRGLVRILGDFVQDASGALEIAIAGRNTNQFGRIEITGTAALGGALNIALVDGFDGNLAAGDMFPIVAFAESNPGDFDEFNVANAPDGLQLDALVSQTGVTIAATAALQAFGVLSSGAPFSSDRTTESFNAAPPNAVGGNAGGLAWIDNLAEWMEDALTPDRRRAPDHDDLNLLFTDGNYLAEVLDQH